MATLFISVFCNCSIVLAQSAGNSGTIYGIVTDATGAIIPNATVAIENPVSGYNRQSKTDSSGHYQFNNLPLNPYHLTISAPSFSTVAQDVDIRSSVPIALTSSLKVGETSTTVEVTTNGADLIEGDPVGHTDIDRDLFQKLPLESASSSLSSLVTLASPGVAADSNGLFHGLGDHASNSFNIDGQPITDQQSKIFSNQLPSNSVQSLEVISGAPPAEYGGKTSLVIQVTTRSGQGVTTPTGSVSASFGTFGSATGSIDLSYGGKNWGNFIEVDGVNTGRFLDPPEFAVFHDKGNEFNVFDRIDRQLSAADSVHINLGLSRSWFQTPNTFDNLGVQNVISGGTGSNPVFGTVRDTDQRSKILTYNVAPTYTRTVGANSVFNLGAFVRRDNYNYYPSANPLSDLGPIQGESISQARSLTNVGARSDFSYVKGVNNIKIGALYQHTFLRERDMIGLIDSTFNSPCVDGDGNSLPGFTSPTQCASKGAVSNDPTNDGTYDSDLLPYDLTRGGKFFNYFGHTDIKELALYAQDQITAGNWTVNIGLRGDFCGSAITRQRLSPAPDCPTPSRLPAPSCASPMPARWRLRSTRTSSSPARVAEALSSRLCSLALRASPLRLSPDSATSFTPDCSRPSARTSLSRATTSGSTLTTRSTSASSATRRSSFPSTGTTRRSPASTCALMPNVHGFSAFV